MPIRWPHLAFAAAVLAGGVGAALHAAATEPAPWSGVPWAAGDEAWYAGPEGRTLLYLAVEDQWVRTPGNEVHAILLLRVRDARTGLPVADYAFGRESGQPLGHTLYARPVHIQYLVRPGLAPLGSSDWITATTQYTAAALACGVSPQASLGDAVTCPAGSVAEPRGRTLRLRGEGAEAVFQQGVPFPVALRDASAHLVLRLEAWRRGPSPAEPTPEVPAPFPPVRLGGAWRGLPDDAGAPVALRFEEAVARAAQAPGDPALRAFLAANPEWTIGRLEAATAGATTTFTGMLAGAGESLEFQWTWHLVAGLLVPDPGAGWSRLAPAVALQAPPGRLPLVRDMAAALERDAGLPSSRAWGYDSLCDGCAGRPSLWVGTRPEADASPGPAVGYAFGPDGAVVARRERQAEDGGLVELSRPNPVPPPAGEGARPAWEVSRDVALAVAAAAFASWLASKGGWAWATLASRSLSLRHPSRQAILAAIAAAPGIHYQELRRRTGFGKARLEHHLAVLGRLGAIRCQRVGGFTCYALAGVHGVQPVPGRTARAVLDWLRTHPGDAASVSLGLGRSRSTVAYHLLRLERQGVVVRERTGRGSRWSVPAAPRSALIPGASARDCSIPPEGDGSARGHPGGQVPAPRARTTDDDGRCSAPFGRGARGVVW